MYPLWKYITALLLVVASTSPVQGLPRLNGRIVGGTPVDISTCPYQVAFEFFETHICGAAIVSEYWAITAAHCADSTEVDYITIRAGTTILESDGYVHQASAIKTHPNFDFYTLDNDVSLIQVTSPFAYNSLVKAIPIATEEPTAGTSATVTGWGSSYSGGELSVLLQKVTVQIADRTECTEVYAEYGNVTKNMICAGIEEGGKDSCQGDSGGPLVVDGTLVGIVSWGIGCGVRGYPGIYSNVAALSDFINNVTSSLVK